MSKKIVLIDREDFFFVYVLFPIIIFTVHLGFAFLKHKFEKEEATQVLLDIVIPILLYILIISIVFFFKKSIKYSELSSILIKQDDKKDNTIEK